MLGAWVIFLASSVVIAWSGGRVARSADALAESSGLGRVWMGAILVAAITSLPEAVTGLAAVTLAHAPDLAVGDLFGSCVFNLMLLVLVDALDRNDSLHAALDRGHLVPAGFGLLMYSLAGLAMVTASARGTTLVAMLATPALAAIYVIAARTVHLEVHARAPARAAAPRRVDVGQVRALAGWALVVVLAGIAMPFAAGRVADAMRWHESFVGGLFVAMATSLPEIAVTVHAVRAGARDLAVGNLLGSNLFNLLLLAVDDLAWRRGPLLADVDPRQVVQLLSASGMTAVFVIALVGRQRDRRLRLGSAASWLLLMFYVLNAVLLFQHVPES